MKLPDWSDRLWKTITAHAAYSFRWAGKDGEHDCCTFAAACVDAMTGKATLDELLTHYQDEYSAREYIRAAGGIVPLISQYLGRPKDVALMSGGDVAVVRVEDQEVVGICTARDVMIADRRGLKPVPRSLAFAAWEP